MYYINGFNYIIELLSKICGIPTAQFSLTDSQCRQAYHQLLNCLSVFTQSIDKPDILFIDFPQLKPYAKNYWHSKQELFQKNSELLQNRLNGNFFQEALDILRTQNINLYQLSQFIIKIVVINQLAAHTNGTTEDLLGLAILDFKDHYQHEDFIELIIHQLTHMLLFLDERVNPHMPAASKNILIDTETIQFIRGGTKFPIYLAFHSYIVGVEVLCFRAEMGELQYQGNYHGNTERILRICKQFKFCLENNFDLFYEPAQAILIKANTLLTQIEGQFHKLKLEKVTN